MSPLVTVSRSNATVTALWKKQHSLRVSGLCVLSYDRVTLIPPFSGDICKYYKLNLQLNWICLFILMTITLKFQILLTSKEFNILNVEYVGLH